MVHARILYAEDNALLRQTLTDTLELEGWHVVACRNGTAALWKLESDEPFDLLLLDDELPGINGVELAQRARRLKHRERTPVVIISASETGRAARQAGASAFLKKPEDINRVVETIVRLLGIAHGG
jgi:CheY-like chemotaxis protein